MSIANPNVQVSSGYYNNQMPVSYHRTNTEREIGRILAQRNNRGLRLVMRALNGAAPGVQVTSQQVRLPQPAAFGVGAFQGVRVVETVPTQYNGPTTAAQRDYINANIYDPVFAQQTYPVDLSGNGGGGKVQR